MIDLVFLKRSGGFLNGSQLEHLVVIGGIAPKGTSALASASSRVAAACKKCIKVYMGQMVWSQPTCLQCKAGTTTDFL